LSFILPRIVTLSSFFPSLYSRQAPSMRRDHTIPIHDFLPPPPGKALPPPEQSERCPFLSSRPSRDYAPRNLSPETRLSPYCYPAPSLLPQRHGLYYTAILLKSSRADCLNAPLPLPHTSPPTKPPFFLQLHSFLVKAVFLFLLTTLIPQVDIRVKQPSSPPVKFFPPWKNW